MSKKCKITIQEGFKYGQGVKSRKIEPNAQPTSKLMRLN